MQVEQLVRRIRRERFASDFSYEDWASPYRDTLHAAFLGADRAGRQPGRSDLADPRWRLWVGQRTSWQSIPDADSHRKRR